MRGSSRTDGPAAPQGGASTATRGPAVMATAIAAVAPLMWGTTYAVTSELLPPGRPLWSALLRAIPAGLVLVLLARELPARSDWGRLLVLSTLNIGAFFALLFYAAYTLPGGPAATLSSLSPVFALGFGAVWLSARPSAPQLGAAAACVLGVALLVGGGGVAHAGGAVAAVGAGACTAAGVVLMKRWRLGLGIVALTGWQLCLGGLLVSPIVLASGEAPPPVQWPTVIGYGYLGLFGTALAYLAWMRGVRDLPVGAVSALACLSPVTAAAIDIGLLGRHATLPQLAGGALVLAAVLACQTTARPAVSGAVKKSPSPRRAGKVPGQRDARTVRVGEAAADGTPLRVRPLSPEAACDDDLWERVSTLWAADASSREAREASLADAATLREDVAAGRTRLVLATAGPRLVALRANFQPLVGDAEQVSVRPRSLSPDVRQSLLRAKSTEPDEFRETTAP